MKGAFAAITTALLLSILFVAHAHAVEPRNDSSGRYLSPYTSDGVFAEWVNRTVDVRTGEAVGGAAGAAAGAYAADRLMGHIPGASFFGGMAGSQAGKATGREVAIKNAGGEEFMRESSDLSFDRLEDMAEWMHVTHANGANFQDAFKATQAVYPEMEQVYPQVVARVNQERQRAARAGTIGARLNASNGPVVVEEILPDSPAARSDLQVGDTLLRVDGQMIAGLPLDDVITRIRGEVGSPVEVSVVREGEEQILSYSMTREKLVWPRREPEQPAQATRVESLSHQHAQPVPRKTYTEHDHALALNLGLSTGDISGVGFGVAGHGMTSTPGQLGWFWSFRTFISNGDSDDGPAVDFLDLAAALGASFSVNDTIRLYGGLAYDSLDFSTDQGDVEVFGFGLRYGAQFIFPDPDIVLRVGARKVSAEEDSSFGGDAELDYTGLELQLEFGLSDEVGFSLGYEQRDSDSTFYTGFGVRF